MPSAEAELEAAYLWLAERNPEAAATWYNGALNAFGTLETFPERCQLAPESVTLDSDYGMSWMQLPPKAPEQVTI